MIPISDEALSVISSRLKLGERAKPVVRVEVDRLAFIPGRTEEFTFLTMETRTEMQIRKIWIPENTDGTYSGSSSSNPLSIAFPIEGKSLDTVKVTSRFGNRDGGFHSGIDLVGSYGENVVAAWSGKVVNITRKKTQGEGFSVTIKHADGVMTKYYHLSQINVALDQTVYQGQIIGKVGNTGNVWTNGHPITAEDRDAGKGAHLHFEIWEGVNQDSRVGEGGKPVDPEAYLKGVRKMYGETIHSGTVIDEGITTGFLGEIKLAENFDNRDWYKAVKYSTSANFSSYQTVEKGWTLYDSGGKSVYTFNKNSTSPISVSFSVDLEKIGLATEGVFYIGFGTNFNGAQGDEFNVKIDGRTAIHMVDFSEHKSYGLDKLAEFKNMYIPAGSKLLTVEIKYGGWQVTTSPGYLSPKKFALDYLRIQELLPQPPVNNKGEGNLDPTKGHWEEIELPELMWNEKRESSVLQVGSFVYMDTLVLPNVISVEIDDQFDQEAREARIEIANPNGFFSPDYNPYSFPEMRSLESPWSYWVNGFHIGVLSENTPIRIYLGYGSNLFRVFTGLIDKVEMTGEDSRMVITCRDMYKKLIEKVITEKKAYPDLENMDNVDDGTVSGYIPEKPPWVKSDVIKDLITHAGLVGWRATSEDLQYPDYVIEETVLIEAQQRTGKVIKAVEGKEGEFEAVDAKSVMTPYGWLNPFVEEYGKTFPQFGIKVNEAINDVIKDLPYRSYCDRYGTYRLEKINYFKPIVATFDEDDNIISISKELDWSRGRSHIVVVDSEDRKGSFIDKEILLELKGEIRTAVISVPWAKTLEAKRAVAERAFFDMKRFARTLQVAIPADPTLELFDRVIIRSKSTMTFSVYTIKGIRTSFSVDNGMTQILDLMWASKGTVV